MLYSHFSKFFTTTGQAPLVQAKLTLGPGNKAGKAKKVGRKAKSKDISVKNEVESDGEDVAMHDAPAASEALVEEERSSEGATQKEKPKTSRKRGRSPSETKLPLERTGIEQAVEKEVAEVKEKKLRKKASSESESEAVKPLKRRGRPPKIAEAAEDIQKVKVKSKVKLEASKDTHEEPLKGASALASEPKAVEPLKKRGRPPKIAEAAKDMQKVKVKLGVGEDTHEEPWKGASASASEPEAIKPLHRRGRKPKTEEVAEDMQKVKLSDVKSELSEGTHEEPRKGASSELELEAVKPLRRGKKPKTEEAAEEDMQLSEGEAKTSKKENVKPRKAVGPARKLKAAATVKAEPATRTLESDAEVSSESESSLKKPAITLAARKKVQAKLFSAEHPYRDWRVGSPVPYAAICKSFTLIEGTTKRLEKLAHTSLLLQQVLRLTPDELLLVVHLMCNKLAAEFEGIELGIGESLLMKAIAESCGRTTDKIRAQLNKIGDLGIVAQQSRSNQSTLTFKRPKPLTVADVHAAFLKIATTAGNGAQQAKVDLIKKLLANATKEGDEAKYIVRALEGKMRLGLADRTIEVALSQAVITWEQGKLNNKPSLAQLQEAEEIMKGVYRYSPCA